MRRQDRRRAVSTTSSTEAYALPANTRIGSSNLITRSFIDKKRQIKQVRCFDRGAPRCRKWEDDKAEARSRGALVLAGPMSDQTGDEVQGTGLIVHRAASFDAARALAEADPMHTVRTRAFTPRK